MLKEEFEALAKRTVTNEQYKMIEGLYMASDLDKQTFVKSIKTMLNSIPEEHHRQTLVMAIHNKFGEMTTPNGCWYLTVLVELIDISIKSGKKIVKVIPNSFECRYGYDLNDWDRNLEVLR